MSRGPVRRRPGLVAVLIVVTVAVAAVVSLLVAVSRVDTLPVSTAGGHRAGWFADRHPYRCAGG